MAPGCVGQPGVRCVTYVFSVEYVTFCYGMCALFLLHYVVTCYVSPG